MAKHRYLVSFYAETRTKSNAPQWQHGDVQFEANVTVCVEARCQSEANELARELLCMDDEDMCDYDAPDGEKVMLWLQDTAGRIRPGDES